MQAIRVLYFFQIATIFTAINGQCPWQNDAMPSVENGYRSNVDNLTLYSSGLAYGSYEIRCEFGYELNPAIGGRITCLPSGSWSSPLPQCQSTGRCSIPTLFTFLQTSPGVRFSSSNSFIYTDGIMDDQALGGSNITVYCANGYQNIGGPLAIVCTKTNSWTTFPNCKSTMPLTSTTPGVPRCPMFENIWTFQNGYLSNTSGVTVYSDDTAFGFVIVSCSPGYLMDSISNGLYSCYNGAWSPRPYCIKTVRCSLATLQSFLSNPTATIGLQVSSQYLTSYPEPSDEIFIGSYILFTCSNGYTNTDNNLNVTCNNNGQWSAYPKCVSTMPGISTGRCSLINGALPVVANSYLSNAANVRIYTSDVAEGYYDVSCNSGYELDPAIGGRITCLESGSWSSPLPQCTSTGRCYIPTLYTFLQTSPGVRYSSSNSFVYTESAAPDQAIGGSNITIYCASGYQNVGGPLTIVCTRANSWTTFPNCISTTSSTASTAGIPRCPVTEDTWTFENGYLSNTSGITIYSDDTALGFAGVSCSSGYVMDSVSGGLYRCNNGVWSARPYCTKTARCSLATLRNFVSDPVAIKGLEISSQSLSVESETSDEVLIGSYMLFTCQSGFTSSTNNDFNVVCNDDGQWSDFPSCSPANRK